MDTKRRVRVALDAMGGDYAPGDIVEGAVRGAEKTGAEVILVGQSDVVQAELAKYDTADLPLRCVHADEVVTEYENPGLAVRRKQDASINVAARLVRSGEADCLLSAGPTGAVVISTIQNLGLIEGVERPVMGGAIFDTAPNTIVFDLGVNVDCKPYHLLTFAAIGTAYCKKLLGIARPTVGLLNIGAEESKGNQLTKETHALLKASSLNFIGNIEGNQMMSGRANVLVCDAFVGNILFKLVESLGLFHDSAGGDEEGDLAGGIVWGLSGIVRKLHGASRAPHVALKIGHAKQVVEVDLVNAVKAELTATLKGIKR